MSKSAFDLLQESLHTVRLHGWCAQTYDLLDQLQAELLDAESSTLERVDAKLNEKISSSLSMDERVLSLLTCSLRGAEMTQISELAFTQLRGKLTRQAYNVFLRFFYDDVVPIPADLVYDITQRTYLTYQRAIYRTMQIEEFDSHVPASLVVLYLTLLLCTDSLNEQNRAMVHLLLSRIDEPLPSSVESTVRRAMDSLEAVVDEVVEKKETVLSAPLRVNQMPKAEWGKRQREEQSAPSRRQKSEGEQVEAEARSAGRFQERPKTSYAGSGPEPTGPTSPTPDPVGAQSSFRLEERPREAARLHSQQQRASDVAPFEAPSVVDRPERSTHVDATPPAEDAGTPSERSDGGRDSARGLGADRETVTGRSSEQPEIVIGEHKPETRSGRFSIRFTRRSDELEAILDKMGGKSAKANEPENENAGHEPAGHRRVRRKLGGLLPNVNTPWRWYIPPAVATLVAVLLFAVAAPATGVGIAGVGAREATGVSQAARNGPSPAVEPAEASAVSRPEPPVGGGGGEAVEESFPLVEQNGALVWRPNAGDSLWALFSHYLETGAQPLSLPADQTWQRFLSRVSELNPDIAEIDLIQPSQPIRIDLPGDERTD